MSVRASTGRPWTCSGDMYRLLPTMAPVLVTSVQSGPVAIPKSVSLACPFTFGAASCLGVLGMRALQHLYGYVALKSGIKGLIDSASPSPAQDGAKLIAVLE